MADATVAMNALKGILADGAAADDQIVDKPFVATDARILEDRGVAGLDLDRFVEIHESEALGMPKSVIRLGKIFGDEIMREVAVHAGGPLVMAALLPRVILIVHHVAVRACPGVLGEITQAFSIIEGEESQPYRQSNIKRRGNR